MKIAIVVQRYGEEVVGGAETLARSVAERLVSDLRWEVDVVTTTARDYETWQNHFSVGWSELNGVRVSRFDSRRERSRTFSRLNGPLSSMLLALQRARIPDSLLLKLERLWFEMQGPVNPQISRYISDNLRDYDRVICFTYLYLPTILGIRIAGDKGILVPAAHDERPFHFLTIQRELEAAGHILANSTPERELLISRGVPVGKVGVAGMGVDAVESLARGDGSGVDSGVAALQPYVLYLGRISGGKQVGRLISDFESFHQQSRFGDVRLLLAGRKDESFELPERPWLKYLGYLPEERKAALIAGAACVVNPSSLESMSLIVVEALALGRPALVNSSSPTLNFYVDSVESVFGYDDQDSFNSSLSDILSRDWRDDAGLMVLEESRRWVVENYSWKRVMEKYRDAVERPLISQA